MSWGRSTTLDQWLLLALAVISGTLALSAAAFATFETKDHSKENRESIERRLERIEEKLDRLLGG